MNKELILKVIAKITELEGVPTLSKIEAINYFTSGKDKLIKKIPDSIQKIANKLGVEQGYCSHCLREKVTDTRSTICKVCKKNLKEGCKLDFEKKFSKL